MNAKIESLDPTRRAILQKTQNWLLSTLIPYTLPLADQLDFPIALRLIKTNNSSGPTWWFSCRLTFIVVRPQTMASNGSTLASGDTLNKSKVAARCNIPHIAAGDRRTDDNAISQHQTYSHLSSSNTGRQRVLLRPPSTDWRWSSPSHACVSPPSRNPRVGGCSSRLCGLTVYPTRKLPRLQMDRERRQPRRPNSQQMLFCHPHRLWVHY